MPISLNVSRCHQVLSLRRCLLGVMALCGVLSSAHAAGSWPSFDATPSGRANQGGIERGEFVGTDEIHFAAGANADGLHHDEYFAALSILDDAYPTPVETDDVIRHLSWGAFGTDRSAHNGDYLLPTDHAVWPDFTADLVYLRMTADATDLYVQLRFASFPSPTSQIATITFATSATPLANRSWPRNAGVSSAHSLALTMWGSDAELSSATGAAKLLSAAGGEVRITDHAIEARIPLNTLPAGPWRIGVGAGLADPVDPSQYWTVPAGQPTATAPGTSALTAPGSNVWDLMFTPRNPEWFDDYVQADLLSSGDVSAAFIEVDPRQLQSGVTTMAPVVVGRVAHVYQSAFDFGDGIARGSASTPPIPIVVPPQLRVRDPAVSYEYTGAMQPYFAYIPEAYPQSTEKWPLILYFHGLNNYIWEPFGLTLGLEQQLEQRGYLFASLLGRGDLYFEGRGELDPLEVIADMKQRYRIDEDRIYLLGHSHGAQGVMNVSMRNPDLFAGVVSAQISGSPDVFENLRYVPSVHIAGAADPIDNGDGARNRYTQLSSLGYDTQLYIYAAKTHENSSIYDTITQIFDLYDRSRRPKNPATVIYTRAGGDLNEPLGLLHNRAYWVSGLAAADPALDMHVEAESFAIPHMPLDPMSATRSPEAVVDTGGVSGRSNALYSQTTPAYSTELPVQNRAAFTSLNVIAAHLDVKRMSLDLSSADAAIDVTLDRDVSLTLTNIDAAAVRWETLGADGAQLAKGSATMGAAGFVIPVSASARRVKLVAGGASVTGVPGGTDSSAGRFGGSFPLGLIASLFLVGLLRRRQAADHDSSPNR